MLGLGAAGIVTGGSLADRLGRVLAPVQSRDPTGLTGLLPAGGGFRYYSVTASVPVRTAADYRLTVTGLVERPLSLTLGDLAGMPQTSLVRDFQCVTGWRVRNVAWSGVTVAQLLETAGVLPRASAVAFGSLDGTYTESLTLDQARRPDVIAAGSMQGGPVTVEHGGPVRLYVAPMYGYKSLKWLDRIELTAAVQPGYWEQRDYDVDAWVGRSNGRQDDRTG